MRPVGEIRQALERAAFDLYQERGAVPIRAIAERAQVGFGAAQKTVNNMASAGVLARVGKEKLAGSGVWVTLFEPAVAQEGAQNDAAAGAIDAVVRSWAEFR